MRNGSDEKLKLGKGASFFLKAQLRRLRQKDDAWRAGFFPIPCSDSEHDSVWWGIVLNVPRGQFPKVTKTVGKSPPHYADEDE